MPEAPWMQALEAGAQAGLGQRRAADEELQFAVRSGQEEQQRAAETKAAADRLRLAYNQLHANERAEAIQASNKMQLEQAAMALRSAQNDALNQYHQAALADKDRQIAELTDYRNQRLGQFSEALDQKQQAQKDIESWRATEGQHYANEDARSQALLLAMKEKWGVDESFAAQRIEDAEAARVSTARDALGNVTGTVTRTLATQPATQLPGVAADPSASTPPTAPSPNLLPPGPNGELQLPSRGGTLSIGSPSGGTSLPAPAISPTPAASKNKQWKLVNGELVPVNSDQNGQ